jgi:hypothetical protein
MAASASAPRIESLFHSVMPAMLRQARALDRRMDQDIGVSG